MVPREAFERWLRGSIGKSFDIKRPPENKRAPETGVRLRVVSEVSLLLPIQRGVRELGRSYRAAGRRCQIKSAA